MMFRWVSSLTPEARAEVFDFVAGDLATGGALFGSRVVKTVPLAEWRQAIAESEKYASEGKYLLKCI
jgi:hypothetical protein